LKIDRKDADNMLNNTLVLKYQSIFS